MHTFKQLHQQATPLIIANVWDAKSAQLAEQAGYLAVATSSAAIAELLGYEDGEQMPFNALLFMVERIAAVTQLPLSVDIEAGYSEDPKVIADHIEKLAELGVVGINIEDSQVKKQRELLDAQVFSERLRGVCSELARRKVEVFINVRCDVFLLAEPDALIQACERAKVYQSAGADGLFFPCLTDLHEIQTVAASTSLPLNVMAMNSLSDFERLAQCGVKRVSMGNFAHSAMHITLANMFTTVLAKQACAPLFN